MRFPMMLKGRGGGKAQPAVLAKYKGAQNLSQDDTSGTPLASRGVCQIAERGLKLPNAKIGDTIVRPNFPTVSLSARGSPRNSAGSR
jgi:hypothetical protein